MSTVRISKSAVAHGTILTLLEGIAASTDVFTPLKSATRAVLFISDLVSVGTLPSFLGICLKLPSGIQDEQGAMA